MEVLCVCYLFFQNASVEWPANAGLGDMNLYTQAETVRVPYTEQSLSKSAENLGSNGMSCQEGRWESL